MPVCVTGMHRTGTSMVARLLNLCGVLMGHEDDFAPPSEDNPAGFWENLRFVRINEKLLAHFGGAWDYPPNLEEGWENSPELLSLRAQAAQVVQSFPGTEAWGWKDPRSSLTLPFWRTLISNLKVIICVRDPLSVAASLHKRGGYASEQFSFHIWERYYQQLLDTTNEYDRLITHYDTYFYHSQDELRRILGFLELCISDEVIEKACHSISPSLRHHYIPMIHILESHLPLSSKKLYMELCNAAGPMYQVFSLKHDNAEPDSWAKLAEMMGQNYVIGLREKHLQRQIAQRDEELASIKPVLQAREEELASIKPVLQAREEELASIKPVLQARDEELASVKVVLQAREGELGAVRATLQAREEELITVRAALQAREVEVAGLSRELNAIHHSRVWRIAQQGQRLYRFTRRLLRQT